MAITKTLNTRIQLKYDSYSNWTTNNPTLLQGELAIAYLAPTNGGETTPDNGTHPVLFKVGPGQFNSLPWASALAADVHGWAKAATKPVYTADEIEGLNEKADAIHFHNISDVVDLESILNSYILYVDYYKLLSFDTNEIVINTSSTSSTSILGKAILGQMVLS